MDDKCRNSNEDPEMLDLSIKAAKVKQPLTLPHLPDICLEKILTYLDLDDLTNAADANNGLTNSAIHVFKTKFKNDVMEYRHHKNKLFPKQLKYFGPSMSRISIWGLKLSGTDIAKIFDLMLKYCGPTLNKLTVQDIDYKFELKHRFPLVHDLCFDFSDEIPDENQFNDSWTQIDKYFPSLQTLTFNGTFGCRALNPSFSIHIPSLERVIFSQMQNVSVSLKSLRMAQIVNANPQITYLKVTFDEIYSEMETHGFQSNVNWSSLNITKLEIEGIRLNPKYVAKLKHLNSLSFDTGSYQTVMPLKQPIMELCVSSYETLNNKHVEFIVGFSNLKRLTIKTNEELQTSQLNRLATELPELAEVDVLMSMQICSTMPMDTANEKLELIRKCKTLRSLKLEFRCLIGIGPGILDELYRKHAELEKEFQCNINGMAKHKKWIMTTKSCKWKYFPDTFIFTYNFVTDD